ncbi:MAG: YfdX family protein [Thermotogae bacterium]|nr:YfdX family protein [Thermotogota bacterium]
MMLIVGLLSQSADTSLASRVQEAVQQSTRRGMEELRSSHEQKIIRAAAEVVDGIARLINVLQYGKLEDAKNLLETLIAKTDSLQKHYSIKNLPIGATVVLYIGVEDPDTARRLLKEAKKYLKKNNIPAARDLLNLLRNEIVVNTAIVPIDVLKNSLSLAKSLIEKGKVKEAVDALNLMLSSVETVENVFPKPIFDAYYILAIVSEVQEKDPKLAEELIRVVEKKFELAYVLGYLDKKEYAALMKEVKSIYKLLKGGKKGSKRIASLRKRVEKSKGEIKGAKR